MARIRSIKPAFFRSPDIAALKRVETEKTFIGLWTYCDDYGRGVDDPKLIKAEIWPLTDRWTFRRVEEDLADLADEKAHDPLICRYTVGTRSFLHVVNWKVHQRISHPLESIIPPCPHHKASGNLREDHGNLPQASGNLPEDHGNLPQASGNLPEDHGNLPEDHGNLPKASGARVAREEVEVEVEVEVDGKPPSPGGDAGADPIAVRAHQLAVLAFKQRELPTLKRSRGDPLAAVLGLIATRLKNGTPAETIEAAIRAGVAVWTTDGLGVACSRVQSSNGARAGPRAVSDRNLETAGNWVARKEATR